MKKILAIILLVFTSISLMGCDGFKDIENNLDVDLNDKPDLRGLYPNSGIQNSAFAKSYTTEKTEELTGYTVQYDQVLSGDFKQAVENALLKKEKYNFFKLDQGAYEGLVDKQSFLDLKPYLEKYGPDLLEIIPDYAWESVTYDGKIYGIPEISFPNYGMQDDALVWNMKHLKEVGITKTPETISEVADAFALLEEKNKDNPNYAVFGLPSPQAMCDVLSSAFEVPDEFYEDENGEIVPYIYHPNHLKYLDFLRSFVQDQYLLSSWQSALSADITTNLANENMSCGYLSYWNINNLVIAYAQFNKISEEEARNEFGYSLRIRGDGTHGSVDQETAKFRSSENISYYLSIPSYMGNQAAYVINWMNEKIKPDNFMTISGGLEGVHYEQTTKDDKDAIEINYNNEITYRKLLPKYRIDIEPNSMYATGVNPEVSRALWPCREKSYNCWPILFDLDETIISNPIAIRPYLNLWASKSINARSWIITYEQKYTIAKSKEDADESYEYLQRVFKTRFWTDPVSNQIQGWYSSKE